jgi:hypothetical protein
MLTFGLSGSVECAGAWIAALNGTADEKAKGEEARDLATMNPQAALLHSSDTL